jgi:hypothetical protein
MRSRNAGRTNDKANDLGRPWLNEESTTDGTERFASGPRSSPVCAAEEYRYDAGHGSLVIDEQIRQVEMQIAFAARNLGTQEPIAT